MPKLSVVGYPRIGARRELKKGTESYFAKQISRETLQESALRLRERHWSDQRDHGIDFIPSNDFSFYDPMLDMAFLLNVIPGRYQTLGLDPLDTYFAMAKGHQTESRDVKALPMKKWFNTNYHYIVPAFEAGVTIRLNGDKPFREYQEALSLGIQTKPVLIGPFTFLKLAKAESGPNPLDYRDAVIAVYQQILERFETLNADWVQLDEPVLVTDLTPEEIELFQAMYRTLLRQNRRVKILLQTYFGDIRDLYSQVAAMDCDAIGLDLVEGEQNLALLETNGFPAGKLLFAGVVNGKNIWINDYQKTLKILERIAAAVGRERIVLSSSCSLLHVPYSVSAETNLEPKYRRHFAFAEEKLAELKEIARLWDEQDYAKNELLIANASVIATKAESDEFRAPELRKRISGLTESDFTRIPRFDERILRQKARLNLPKLPTTTIGSFPQTPEVRKLRKSYHDGAISRQQYDQAIKQNIADVIRLQEEIGLDVLVHGEYERNDMVEYFGQNLSGFLFTQNGWVQSYGTRCVKPPIIFGDVTRTHPITVDYITHAQRLTAKPVKGMLTGPVTILNWSFVREDLPLPEIACQIALAIKAEVTDLEAGGIGIIQIDEAALREKLPLRREDWQYYLDWAVRAFRLTHASVKPQTQIHTHMCYSEFGEIIPAIVAMDADVITFEAAKSDLSILAALHAHDFQMETGPGVYDVHSPRVPGPDEIKAIIVNILKNIDPGKVWINPDCGLKTRGIEETVASLKNMVAAATELREGAAAQTE
jgi:5-methyltetrahydropteroyltriglutamate--homocysteine methyltransferase